MDSNAPAELPNGKSDNGVVNDSQQEHASGFHPDRIAKNTSYLTLALVIQKVLSLVYFVYISRTVGDENIGQYLTALAITTVLGFFVDLSFSQVLIRETAKHPEKTNAFLNAALGLKAVTAVAAYSLAIIYVRIFDYPAIVQSLVLVTGAVMILDSFTLSFYSIFRGHQKLQYEAFGTVANKILVTIVGVFGLFYGFGVRFLVVAILVGSLFNFFYSSVLLIRKLHWRPSFSWDREHLRHLAKIALPWFTLGGIFVTVYGYIDQVLLSNPLLVGAKGPSYVGWYGTAYKLTFAFQFLPAALVAAVFPAMSAYFVRDKELLRKTFERAMFYLMILVVPLCFGILALADVIVIKAYTPVFANSIIPLKILIVSLFFVFLNYPVGYLLFAADRQRRNTVHIGIVMVLNIILNLLLIPQLKYIGAAIASTASSVVLFSLNFFVARTVLAFRGRFLAITLLKTLAAGATMGLGLWLLKDQLSVFILLPLGAVSYFGLLFLLRGFLWSDGVKIYHALVRKVVPQHENESGPLHHS